MYLYKYEIHLQQFCVNSYTSLTILKREMWPSRRCKRRSECSLVHNRLEQHTFFSPMMHSCQTQESEVRLASDARPKGGCAFFCFTPCLQFNTSGSWTLKRTHSAMPDNTEQCECYYKKAENRQAVFNSTSIALPRLR